MPHAAATTAALLVFTSLLTDCYLTTFWLCHLAGYCLVCVFWLTSDHLLRLFRMSVCFFNLLLCTPCRHLPKINNFCVRSFLSGAFISIFVVIFSFIIILLAHFCWSLHTRTRAQYFAHELYSFIPFTVYRRKAIKINIKEKISYFYLGFCELFTSRLIRSPVHT